MAFAAARLLRIAGEQAPVGADQRDRGILGERDCLEYRRQRGHRSRADDGADRNALVAVDAPRHRQAEGAGRGIFERHADEPRRSGRAGEKFIVRNID